MITRPTARILAFDPDDRLLVFKCQDDGNPDPGHVWIAPGGGVERGETDERAVLRELWEEIGIEASAPVGPCVMERKGIGRHPDYGDRDILYVDRYLTIDLSAGESARIQPALVTQSGYLDHRWWSLGELESTREPVWPRTWQQ